MARLFASLWSLPISTGWKMAACTCCSPQSSLRLPWERVGGIHPIDDEISGETSTYVMIYGARDLKELETVWLIAQISYYQARGVSTALLMQ